MNHDDYNGEDSKISVVIPEGCSSGNVDCIDVKKSCNIPKIPIFEAEGCSLEGFSQISTVIPEVSSPDVGECNDVVKNIHPHDVLLGRGNSIKNHIGNIFFRRLVSHRKGDYRKGYTIDQRKVFAYQIYDEIQKLEPPGRFLAASSDKTKWYRVSETKAVRKICQALRERSPNDPPDAQPMKKSPGISVSSSKSRSNHVKSQPPSCSLMTENSTMPDASRKFLPVKNSFFFPMLNKLTVPRPGKCNGQLNVDRSTNINNEVASESLPLDLNQSSNHQKDPYHYQQVILPLSYIGESYLNDTKCSNESKFMFEEVAELGKCTNGGAFLYLPSVINGLCKRVEELERRCH